MQIVIDISDERFRDIRRIAEVQTERKHFKTAEQIIANGTLLPKGHGRLKDIDDLDTTIIETEEYNGDEALEVVLREDIDDAPTIIPADTESED